MKRQPLEQPSDDLSSAVGFLISETSRHVRRSLYARIAAYEVRGGSWYPLRVLWQQDGLTQRDIALRLGITEPSVQEMIRAMEKDGLVERKRDTEDKRKIRIYLTSHAQTLRGPLLAIADEVNGVALQALNKTEQKQFMKMLRQVCSSLSEDFEILADRGENAPLNYHEESRPLTPHSRRSST